MDNQHKDIIHLMNMLLKHRNARMMDLNSEFFTLLSRLIIALTHHFIEEEFLLEQNGCPWFEEHAVDHAYIISKLSETDSMDPKEIADQRIPLLQSLLESHVTQDLESRDYLSG